MPQTACEPDPDAAIPMLDQLEQAGRKPEEMLADTLYTGDENVQAAAAPGMDLVGPVHSAPEADAEAMTVNDFGWDERTGAIDTCPSGSPANIVRTRRGDGSDANRDARFGVL